jgi:hypothetical protein
LNFHDRRVLKIDEKRERLIFVIFHDRGVMKNEEKQSA